MVGLNLDMESLGEGERATVNQALLISADVVSLITTHINRFEIGSEAWAIEALNGITSAHSFIHDAEEQNAIGIIAAVVEAVRRVKSHADRELAKQDTPATPPSLKVIP